MAFKRQRVQGWWKYYEPEQDKAHDELPDSLGLGIREENNGDGLYIWLKPKDDPGEFAFHPYIVLGKYRRLQDDGSLFYVADWTMRSVNAPVSKHDHLLTALAAIQEIIDTYEGTEPNENVQD